MKRRELKDIYTKLSHKRTIDSTSSINEQPTMKERKRKKKKMKQKTITLITE